MGETAMTCSKKQRLATSHCSKSDSSRIVDFVVAMLNGPLTKNGMGTPLPRFSYVQNPKPSRSCHHGKCLFFPKPPPNEISPTSLCIRWGTVMETSNKNRLVRAYKRARVCSGFGT